MITQEELKRLLNYDPETGIFTWKEDRFSDREGKVAGCKHKLTGYIQIKVFGKMYKGHRLAWLYVYGEFPTMLDHKNRIKHDNRIANLRVATRSENNFNVSLSNSTTGVRGVCKYGKKYRAQIKKEGKHYYLGNYLTLEEAKKVWEEKAKELYGDFALDLMENTQENENGLV